MNWINGFELLCYAITLVFLADIIKKRAWQDLFLFISAAIAGFTLELLAVRVTDIYHYSTDFYISIGFKPYQFPFFGGLMWGGLTVYALRIAKRLNLRPLLTALVSGWLIVTMDLFLDVAAIRLNGGFWVWDSREITLEITHHMFMSVIWVNFLGYMFETPAMVYLTLKTEDKRKALPWWKQLLAAIGIGFSGVAFVGAASGISLLLNSVSDEWFACIVFILVWLSVLVIILKTLFSGKSRIQSPGKWDLPVLIYWTVMYGFCIAALVYLGISREMPIYFASGIILGAMTTFLGVRESILEKQEART